MDRYTNWGNALVDIPNKNEKTILELGCGVGTKMLIDQFKKVYSFESARTIEWYNKCLTDYGNSENWVSQFHLMRDLKLETADDTLLCSGGKTRDIDSIANFHKLLEKFVDVKSVDVVLVDQGFHFRGESINFFFEKEIPFIIVHDINDANTLYGYDLIREPKNYESKNYSDTRLYLKK